MYDPKLNPCKGWMNDAELSYLYQMVIKRAKVTDTLRIAEIGCWKGRSTHALLSALATLSSYSILYCVDNWSKADHGETDEIRKEAKIEFAQNTYNVFLKTNYNNVITLDQSSTSFLKDCAETGLKLDIMFLDANHSYEAVKKDLKEIWPVLKDGGVLIGHDYRVGETPTNGVRRAVNEMFKKSDIQLIKGGSIFQIFKKEGAKTR